MTATYQIYTLLVGTWLSFMVLIAYVASLHKRIENLEKAAEQCVHLTGLTPRQKEEVRQMIQSALDTGSA